jgi:hypothetical protein
MQIPNKLAEIFMIWLWRGGHKFTYRKREITMKRNGKDAIFERSSDIGKMIQVNDYAYSRWLVFLNQWLDQGVSLINELKKVEQNAQVQLNKKAYLGVG